jgi:hypothetical protein
MVNMILRVLGAALVFATIWAALQFEGVPTDSCAGEVTDTDAGKAIPSSKRARSAWTRWRHVPAPRPVLAALSRLRSE